MVASKKRVVVKDEAHIKVLAKKNPRREGTGRYRRFECYSGSPTVKAVLQKRVKGVNRRGIRRDIQDGLISLTV